MEVVAGMLPYNTKILWSFVLKLNWCDANGYTILRTVFCVLCENVANLQYAIRACDVFAAQTHPNQTATISLSYGSIY